MDDMARDYVAMGVIAEEDIEDIKKCLHCRNERNALAVEV